MVQRDLEKDIEYKKLKVKDEEIMLKGAREKLLFIYKGMSICLITCFSVETMATRRQTVQKSKLSTKNPISSKAIFQK